MTIEVSKALEARIVNYLTGATPQAAVPLAVGASCVLNLYSGSAPGIENAATGTFLGAIPLNGKLGAESGGLCGLLESSSIIVSEATSAIGYARWADAAGVEVIEGSVGVVSSGADFILSSTTATIGVELFLLGCTIGLPLVRDTAKFNSIFRGDLLDKIVLDTGAAFTFGSNCFIAFAAGSIPTDGDDTATISAGTNLAFCTLSTQSWDVADTGSGIAQLLASIPVSVIATGTIDYVFWVYDDYVMILSAGTVGSGADVIIDSALSVTSGGTFNIVEMNLGF
jgi:hypothetical protein